MSVFAYSNKNNRTCTCPFSKEMVIYHHCCMTNGTWFHMNFKISKNLLPTRKSFKLKITYRLEISYNNLTLCLKFVFAYSNNKNSYYLKNITLTRLFSKGISSSVVIFITNEKSIHMNFKILKTLLPPNKQKNTF